MPVHGGAGEFFRESEQGEILHAHGVEHAVQVVRLVLDDAGGHALGLALHRPKYNPELDRNLPETMEYLKKSLECLNCRVFSPMEGALCAYFDFGAQKAIAFRSDADALPISERTDLPFASAHPDNPVTETGVRTELTHDGVGSRRGRSDARHQLLDPLLVAGPWVAGAGAAVLGGRRLVRALRR